jgi:hypothetical protein
LGHEPQADLLDADYRCSVACTFLIQAQRMQRFPRGLAVQEKFSFLESQIRGMQRWYTRECPQTEKLVVTRDLKTDQMGPVFNKSVQFGFENQSVFNKN